MRILIISTRFLPHIGGVEDVVEKLAKSLAPKNELKVITSLNLDDLVNKKRPNSKVTKLLWKMFLGFKVADKENVGYEVDRFWLNLPRSLMGFLSFPYRFIFSALAFIREVKKFKPEVINYHFPDDSSIYVFIMILFVKKPLVLNIHGNDLHFYSNRFPYSFLIEKLVNRADRIIVNSEYMKKEFRKRFLGKSRKIVIVPNSVDVEVIQKIKPRPYFSEDYVFFVGRMVDKKAVDVLLKAFSVIEDKTIKLLLEGSGVLLNQNIQLANDLGLNERVVFTKGTLNYTEKTAYMKAATIGVIPSRIEPFGIVALEMLAGGIPIVASETGGLKSILKEGKTALFFQNEKFKSLAKRIDVLLNDDNLKNKLVTNGLKEVQKYKLKNVTKRYMEVYNTCA